MKKNNANEIYTRVQANPNFGVCKGNVYLHEKGNWKFLSEDELAIVIRTLFNEQERMKISSTDIKEVIARMVQDPMLQMKFIEDEKQNYINLQNGVFNVETGELELHSKEKPFAYMLKFNYIPDKDKRTTEIFDSFLNTSFPYDTEIKKQLTEEILGHVISDYRDAKVAHFLIGESNSGKSTILELLRTVLPENQVTAIPLYRLGNRFGLGKLSESRVNISTELSEKSFQAVDIFKMLTSNEIVTGEHKGKKPFEFRLKCKSINAGNIIPNLGNIDGRDAILNRMVILYFPTSIPKEKQDMHLLEKLEAEKDSIFSNALDALVRLNKNNFKFVVPEDSRKIKDQLASEGKVLENFIEERCIKEKDARIHCVDLFNAFNQYCEENLMEVHMTKNQFSQKVSRIEGLSHGKFRIDGSVPLAGINGIRLKSYKEFGSKETDSLNADYENTEKNTIRKVSDQELSGQEGINEKNEERIPA